MRAGVTAVQLDCKSCLCVQRVTGRQGILHHPSVIQPVSKQQRRGSVQQRAVFRHTCSATVPRAQVSILLYKLTPSFAKASATITAPQRPCLLLQATRTTGDAKKTNVLFVCLGEASAPH